MMELSKNRLVLHVKREYFNAIKEGRKPKEYRPATIRFVSYLLDHTFDQVVICLGYPKLTDPERVLIFPWLGFEEETITHKEFGPDPVRVIAIKLYEEATKSC